MDSVFSFLYKFTDGETAVLLAVNPETGEIFNELMINLKANDHEDVTQFPLSKFEKIFDLRKGIRD